MAVCNGAVNTYHSIILVEKRQWELVQLTTRHICLDLGLPHHGALVKADAKAVVRSNEKSQRKHWLFKLNSRVRGNLITWPGQGPS